MALVDVPLPQRRLQFLGLRQVALVGAATSSCSGVADSGVVSVNPNPRPNQASCPSAAIGGNSGSVRELPSGTATSFTRSTGSAWSVSLGTVAEIESPRCAGSRMRNRLESFVLAMYLGLGIALINPAFVLPFNLAQCRACCQQASLKQPGK